MKKIAMMVIVMAGLVVNASAALTNFRWYNTAANNLLNNTNGVIASSGATVLTYLSTDSACNFSTNSLLSATYGDDFFYSALGNGLPGRLTTGLMAETVTDYRGKFVYAVILNIPFGKFTNTVVNGGYNGLVANVPALTWYTITAPLALSSLPSPTAMTITLANKDILPAPTAQDIAIGNLKTDMQVIPEPATALLFGIGAMGAWMVRRNKLKSKEQIDA
jgi:hypothetical protein